MGRQVTVSVADIEGAGAIVERGSEEIDGYTIHWARVRLPDGREFVDDTFDDSLVFDCRNATSLNRWFEMWLDDNGIPYHVS